MFINTAEFPPIKEGKEEEFIKWFEWSNTIYKNFEGFISRKLLKPKDGKGNYIGLVEHESEKSFMAMHLSLERKKAWENVYPLLDGSPKAKFYNVIISSN